MDTWQKSQIRKDYSGTMRHAERNTMRARDIVMPGFRIDACLGFGEVSLKTSNPIISPQWWSEPGNTED